MREGLKARLLSGSLLGGGFIAAFIWAEEPFAMAVLAGLLILGLREFYSLLDAARIPNFRILGTAASLLLLAGVWADHRFVRSASALQWETLALFLGVFAVFLRQFYQTGNGRPLETMAGTLLGLLYIGFFLTFYARILFAWGEMSGRWLLLYMVAVVKFTDIGAYFIGCRFGRHKLIPRISPAKTWEGCIGGMATALLLSLIVRWVGGDSLGGIPFTWRDALLLPPLLSVAGIFGDLMESLLKRSAGLKDSGGLFIGMGGLLDVIDSLLPSAAVLYWYAILLMKPHGI
ncbi:MAG: phosphatidate cytidylyltransferase [Kiritimatiellia bacterium]|nr:phosphatidate cytidylyltransferase [Kiritimatiellia bacterium]